MSSILKAHSMFFEHRGGVYRTIKVSAGKPTTERIVPPAGEDHAFDFENYPVTVEVTVSPTGRSVHVHVNGEPVYP
jgi:hypothetical protein